MRPISYLARVSKHKNVKLGVLMTAWADLRATVRKQLPEHLHHTTREFVEVFRAFRQKHPKWVMDMPAGEGAGEVLRPQDPAGLQEGGADDSPNGSIYHARA